VHIVQFPWRSATRDGAVLELLYIMHVLCTRNSSTLLCLSKITCALDVDKCVVVLQLVLRLFSCPGHVLVNFDVDCCCVAYDGSR
jgi:signal recognition particle receptor subunit beta